MNGLRFRQIHLDFHTSPLIEGIGRDFDGEEFAQTLKEAGVDSITCFSRCHHGWIYHDTKFENRHPHLECNLLGEQIEACHRHDIRVPIYITVGWDVLAGNSHPEWREVSPDGKLGGAEPLKPGWPKLCLNTPYIDYVEAQTGEVLDMFDVDGFFFDIIFQGECCCRYCMDGMQQNGYDPESAADRRRYSAQVLENFRRRMTDFVRSKNKECAIFYNAGHVGPYIRNSLDTYTHLELESLPSGGWGYEHFPVTARYGRNLGHEFLGMTGKFHKSWADFSAFKNPAALEYECFTSLALGGRCSVGDQLHPSGRISQATYQLIGGVYRQVAEKEPWCVGAKAVTEIGVVTPEVMSPDTAHRMEDAAAGVYRMLDEKHYQFDFVDFDTDLSQYKVVILPDSIRLTEAQSTILNDYLKGGGKLLASYHSGMGQDGFDFAIANMPAQVVGDALFSPDFLVADESIADGILPSEHVMYERGLELEMTPGARPIADVEKPYFERNYKHFCSHAHTPVEGPAGYPGIVANDQIVYVGYPIFGMYKRHGSRVYRDMVMNALRLLLPDGERLVKSSAPTTADITLNYQPAEDRYVLHVLHYIPERRFTATDTIEDVIPLFNVEVDLLIPPGYDKAVLVPQDVEISAVRNGDHLHITIPQITGHQMVAVGKLE